MTNPATTLLGLFEKWNGAANQAPFNIRGFGQNQTAAWKDHEIAIRAIAEIARTLDRLEAEGYKVTSFRSGIKLSTKALMNFPYHWQQPGGAPETITQHLFDVVGNLEGYLDSHTLTLSSVGVANVEDLLNQVIAGLNDDPNLSAQLRAHILRIVQAIRDCIEEYGLTGETDLRQAMHDLWISLFAAAGATTEEKRGFWQNLATNVGFPAAGSAIGSLPGVAASLILTQG